MNKLLKFKTVSKFIKEIVSSLSQSDSTVNEFSPFSQMRNLNDRAYHRINDWLFPGLKTGKLQKSCSTVRMGVSRIIQINNRNGKHSHSENRAINRSRLIYAICDYRGVALTCSSRQIVELRFAMVGAPALWWIVMRLGRRYWGYMPCSSAHRYQRNKRPFSQVVVCLKMPTRSPSLSPSPSPSLLPCRQPCLASPDELQASDESRGIPCELCVRGRGNPFLAVHYPSWLECSGLNWDRSDSPACSPPPPGFPSFDVASRLAKDKRATWENQHVPLPKLHP